MLEPGRRGLSRWETGRSPCRTEANARHSHAASCDYDVVFILTTIMKSDQVWIPYVRAFAEAAMVGACADWFALWRCFGGPSACNSSYRIVPANQQRIGESLAASSRTIF